MTRRARPRRPDPLAVWETPTLDRILDKLARAPADPRRAEDLARLAYLEWLATLPGDAGFVQAAVAAHGRARPVARHSLAAAVFRRLLRMAAEEAPRPLALSLPSAHRRGGTRTRRLSF